MINPKQVMHLNHSLRTPKVCALLITCLIMFASTIVSAHGNDFDRDGIFDQLDNCVDVANADQSDTDGDGIGNRCDPDFNNDCVVNFGDIALFANEFQGSNALFDINSDGAVNFGDFVVVTQSFLLAPGPGLGSCE